MGFHKCLYKMGIGICQTLFDGVEFRQNIKNKRRFAERLCTVSVIQYIDAIFICFD